ncbi:MAG: DUF4242 domain-containing protein [Terrimonas sp.]|nr:DUF4242 domain-containing protein [Terrimonas sp.]
MSKFIIERNIPQIGTLSASEMQAGAQRSNETIRELGGSVQWVQSYVTNDKLYCVYLGTSKDAVLEHAEKSGFPASRVEEVKTIIDPTTGE